MLNVNSGFSEIRPKNLETIKTLISVAYSDCNYLEESWYDVRTRGGIIDFMKEQTVLVTYEGG